MKLPKLILKETRQKGYILLEFIYMKFKTQQNSFLVIRSWDSVSLYGWG